MLPKLIYFYEHKSEAYYTLNHGKEILLLNILRQLYEIVTINIVGTGFNFIQCL